MPIVKKIDDLRAYSDIGSAIFVKRSGAEKYSLWLTVNNIPATGSAPDQIETTVTTSRSKNYVFGRKDNGQKECTFMAHRDNFMILKKDYNKKLDFLQVNPDGTGWKFQGYVSMYQDEVTLGAALTGKAVITVSSADDLPIDDVSDIIEETVTFISAVDDVVKISGTNTYSIVVETDPSDATIAATSATTAVATATVSGQTITLTGVKAGSSIVEVKATKSGCADGVTHILVVVTE